MTAFRRERTGADSLLCLFLPFLLGLVSSRSALGACGGAVFWGAAVLMLLGPSSVYGPLLSIIAFFVFGLCFGTVLGEKGRILPWTFVDTMSRFGLYLWIPVLFCLGQFGLNGSKRLRQGKEKTRDSALRLCLHTTMIQLAALAVTTLCSHWLTSLHGKP